MDVRDGELRLARRADRADHGALRDRRAALDGDRAEVDERDGVAVVGPNRDRVAVRGQDPGERDGAAAGGEHALTVGAPDLDAAPLAPGVGIVAAAESPEHGAGRRPRPRARCGREEQEAHRREKGRSQ